VISSSFGAGTGSTLYAADEGNAPNTTGTLHFAAGFATDADCVDRTQPPFRLAADQFDEPSKKCAQKEDKSQGKAKGRDGNL